MSRHQATLMKVVAPVVGAMVVIGAFAAFALANSSATRAATVYHQQRQALDAALRTAARQGYTSQDLAPVTSQIGPLDRGQAPWWVPGRSSYYQDLTVRTSDLRAQLAALERRLFQQAQAAAGKDIATARTTIGQDQQANAADSDVLALQQRLDAVARSQGAAHTLKDYRVLDQQAMAVVTDAKTLLDQTQQENGAVQQAAQQLIAQTGGNLGAIQGAGNGALAGGRNDASVAAYMNKSGPFKGWDLVQRAYNRLEKYGAEIGAADVATAALGAAGAQRYAGQIHDALINGLPAQAVIVSFQAQHLWAYQNGQVVLENAVTTGIRGVTDFGTDFGPMKVLRKSHPWTMHSPWPKTSIYYYPDTVVQWTLFFTDTGEAIHDAYWEPDSELGPGSQYNASTRSHGCIHLPLAKSEWMYNWAAVGTPVIVYPGDGSPVANQLAQITTDDQGRPLA